MTRYASCVNFTSIRSPLGPAKTYARLETFLIVMSQV
jgi:hypothetical protein